MDLTDFKAFELLFEVVIAAVREAWSVREHAFKSLDESRNPFPFLLLLLPTPSSLPLWFFFDSSSTLQSNMANNNDNNESMHQELVDPLRFVPNETFSKLISFLPPSSIANSSATCTKWREVINSDTTLHREIDLSKMGVQSNPDRIILHLNRLSSLALNQVVKISLDLSSFFEAFEADPRGLGFMNIFHLTKALQQTKDTLRELAFQVHLRDPHNKDHHDHPPQMVHFLLLLLRPLGKGSFSRLVRVQIQAPVGVIAKAGDAVGLPGSREVFLNGKGGKIQWRLSELTQEITHLAGSGFKEFEFDYVSDSTLR